MFKDFKMTTFVYGWFRFKLIFKTRLWSSLYYLIMWKKMLNVVLLNSLFCNIFSESKKSPSMAILFLLRSRCINKRIFCKIKLNHTTFKLFLQFWFHSVLLFKTYSSLSLKCEVHSLCFIQLYKTQCCH